MLQITSVHVNLPIDCINNGHSIREVTHWFLDCCFEASSLHFGRRHLGFIEPEVTIFGREGDTELALSQQLTLAIAD